MTYRKVRVSQGFALQDATSKLLLAPSSAAVYLAGTSTLATLYSNTTGTSLANPVPTGVTPGSGAVGLDTQGNLIVYVDVPNDYEVLVNGTRVPLSTPPWHNHDSTDHVDGTVTDPHGDRAYTATLLAPTQTNVTALQASVTTIQSWTAASIPIDATNGAQGPTIQSAVDSLVANGAGDVFVD